MIELNLDLSDLEKDIENKKKIEEQLKILEIEKIKYFKELAHKYQEQVALTDAKR